MTAAAPIRTAADSAKSPQVKALALIAIVDAIRTAYGRMLTPRPQAGDGGPLTITRLEDPSIAPILGWLIEAENRARVAAPSVTACEPSARLRAAAERIISERGIMGQLDIYLGNRNQALRVVAEAAYAIA